MPMRRIYGPDGSGPKGREGKEAHFLLISSSARINKVLIHSLLHSSLRRSMAPDSLARSPPPQQQQQQPSPLYKIQELLPSLSSQCDTYVDRLATTLKANIKLLQDHPLEAAGVATMSALVLMRAPRRFLIRNTLGRFKTEKDLLNEAESRMKLLQNSLEDLKKTNSGILKKTEFGEEDILRGTANMRSSGKQIQSLVNSIHKAESSAADLMHRLRSLPGRESIELRAEVASMVSDLKIQRRELEQRIFKISELGVHV